MEHNTLKKTLHKRYLVTERQAQVIFEHKFLNLLVAQMESKETDTFPIILAPKPQKKKIIKMTSEQYERLQTYLGRESME